MARGSSPGKAKASVKADPSSVRPTSRGSYASSKVGLGDEASSFGMISAEPGPRASTAASIASSSSGGRKSLRDQLGILRKASRELSCEKDRKAERLRKTSSYNDSLRHNIPRSRASLRSMHSMADLAEEGRPAGSAMEPHQEDVPTTVPKENGHSSPSTAEVVNMSIPGGIGSGRVIPTRESSLRHSYSSSSKKRVSARHSRYSSRGSKDLRLETGVEAEQVTRRIQEVKDQQQRIKSELQGDKSPVRSTRGASARPTHPSRALTDPNPVPLHHVTTDDTRSNLEESAPSPYVMTGKMRSSARSAGPLSSRTPNMQPLALRKSLEKQDLMDKVYSRRSVESLAPMTPLSTRSHRRTPSGPVSPGHASTTEERPSSSDSIDLAVFDYVDSPRLTQRVTHPTSGRTIAFSEVGDPKGYVVLCCLGMGLTRYLMAFYDELARTLKLRLVTLDRPGVGESGPYLDEPGNPLSWPDDVAIVCNHLKVTKFSILAHSAGAIYALATALRIPQHIRGRIHLLAPWIPPSQLSSIGSMKEPVPNNAVPYSQRILRALPTSLLKVANSSFMSATSASITTSLPKSPRRSKRKSAGKDASTPATNKSTPSKIQQQGDDLKALQNMETLMISNKNSTKTPNKTQDAGVTVSQDRERQTDYDNRLTHKIWELATTNANPAVDLLICLERRQPIGFRYVDITRAVVIHHGSRDTRVPVDNVRWLGKMMRRCEVRVLEGEGHGLMASAAVMGSVLTEIAKEWEDWTTVVQGRRRATTVNHGARSGITLQASS
ncbi:hypothetical protein ASPZODRAFT_59243 [Penicilliopsis zonata CBS 506.65]|uniref:AB hydrolase-1 domain-containing protein n=1 Tax=Penicilliopsis zonata CBS 506.65 TaxID=1073090 RepID=A0A1L9SQN7_9EURO|nr:hypothetical protein ASPZODRAFT_59243 [Penicilliopsis zonata CBS 506.65]OJJ49545.1 hypothetical protein ASPZODRAFT_59243 [Penicilliopsis zonata CBS 506.65]